MPSLLPFLCLLSLMFLSNGDQLHLCSQCIDPPAKLVEEVWHSPMYLRLLFDDDWPSCETAEGRGNAVNSSVGCFKAKISGGMVPAGYVYLMQGPMSSILSGVDGEDLRSQPLKGFQKEQVPDHTLFSFQYCQDPVCFTDEPRNLSGPLPFPKKYGTTTGTTTSATRMGTEVTESQSVPCPPAAENSSMTVVYMILAIVSTGLLLLVISLLLRERSRHRRDVIPADPIDL